MIRVSFKVFYWIRYRTRLGLGLGLGFLLFFVWVNGFRRSTLRISVNLGIASLAEEESDTCIVEAKRGACLVLLCNIRMLL